MGKYKKIIIIGSPGSGKTYCSKKISEITNIPVYHLDDFYWDKNWIEKEHSEWMKIQRELLSCNKYIIDGNYLNSLEMRINKSDLIIYMDKKMIVCLKGFIKRTIKNFLGIDIDLPQNIKNQDKYRVTDSGVLKFCIYIIKFHLQQKNKVEDILLKYKGHKKIIILKNKKDISKLYEELMKC